MNVMRDAFLSNRKRKQTRSRLKDIHFFQTVREGSRNYVSKKGNRGSKTGTGTPYFGLSSGSSFSGRTFIRPANRYTTHLNSSAGASGASVVSILQSGSSLLPPNTNSKSLTVDGSCVSSRLDSPPVKRVKATSGIAWADSKRTTFFSPRLSTSRQPTTKNIGGENNEEQNSSLFIEETAEEHCKEFRKNLLENSVQEENKENRSFYIEESAEEKCSQLRADLERIAQQRRSVTPGASLIAGVDSPGEVPSSFQPASPHNPSTYYPGSRRSLSRCQSSTSHHSPPRSLLPHYKPHFQPPAHQGLSLTQSYFQPLLQRCPSNTQYSNFRLSPPQDPSNTSLHDFQLSPRGLSRAGHSDFQPPPPRSPSPTHYSNFQASPPRTPSPTHCSNFQQSHRITSPTRYSNYQPSPPRSPSPTHHSNYHLSPPRIPSPTHHSNYHPSPPKTPSTTHHSNYHPSHRIKSPTHHSNYHPSPRIPSPTHHSNYHPSPPKTPSPTHHSNYHPSHRIPSPTHHSNYHTSPRIPSPTHHSNYHPSPPKTPSATHHSNYHPPPPRTPSPTLHSKYHPSPPTTPPPCRALNFQPSPPRDSPQYRTLNIHSLSIKTPSKCEFSKTARSPPQSVPSFQPSFLSAKQSFVESPHNIHNAPRREVSIAQEYNFDRPNSSTTSYNSSAENTPIKRMPVVYSRRVDINEIGPVPGPLAEPKTPELFPYKGESPKAFPSNSSKFGLPDPSPTAQDPAHQSSSQRPQNCFFTESIKAAAGSSKEDSFFKLPEMPASSASDQYDTLFATPSQAKVLPRITTPQLFLPYNKTPSRATPSQTKSSGKTPQTSSNESFYVISVTEGRGHAVCEVGIAAIDLNHPQLILSQFSDSQTYKKTLAKINVIDPAEMIIPDTFKGLTPSVLYTTVTGTFQDMRVVTVKRNHFSAKLGLDTVRSLLLPECSSLEMAIHGKYYSLAACEALLKYIEIRHGIIITPKTLKVTYESAKDVVSIDLDTCQRLELVMSNAQMVFPEKYSLFGLLNRTQTLGGKRRLRVSLLQPSSSLDVIKERQNSVTALVDDQQSLVALQSQLLKFSNVERLLWLCLKNPNFKNEAKTFETFTNYILLLKTSLEAIPHLRKVLNEIDDDHILNVRDELSNSKYEELLSRILRMIEDDARPARGHAEAERQRCFAIREGVNDLLDVARATYSDLIQLVLDNISELGRVHSLPLKMLHTADLGYHPAYVLPKGTFFDKQQYPDIFTEVKLKNRTVHLLTEEIYAYNMRIKRAMQEIQLITNVVIYDLVESLREEVSFLYRLCEQISDLDILACLAQISSTPDYVRPVFGDEMTIIGGRHPILDHVRPTRPIPNSVFASRKKNFNIITGPNMGGKTIYVLMIPLIQILAQIGCYVPADKAELRLTDHIYVKKGNCDSIERGLSSFTREIRELNYNLHVMSDTSIIILDEICTGTFSDEGTAYAWGYCEEFLKRSAFTFLTTHYHYLTNLAKVYKNVTNYNMEAVDRCASTTEDSGLTFTYRLLKGITTTTNYGLRLLMSSALPKEIKLNALEIAEDMLKKRAESLPLVIPETPSTAIAHSKCEKIENFMYNLFGLSKTENFTKEIVEALQRMVVEEILSDDEDDKGDEINLGEAREDQQTSRKINDSIQFKTTSSNKQMDGKAVIEEIQNEETTVQIENLNFIEQNEIEEFVDQNGNEELIVQHGKQEFTEQIVNEEFHDQCENKVFLARSENDEDLDKSENEEDLGQSENEEFIEQNENEEFFEPNENEEFIEQKGNEEFIENHYTEWNEHPLEDNEDVILKSDKGDIVSDVVGRRGSLPVMYGEPQMMRSNFCRNISKHRKASQYEMQVMRSMYCASIGKHQNTSPRSVASEPVRAKPSPFKLKTPSSLVSFQPRNHSSSGFHLSSLSLPTAFHPPCLPILPSTHFKPIKSMENIYQRGTPEIKSVLPTGGNSSDIFLGENARCRCNSSGHRSYESSVQSPLSTTSHSSKPDYQADESAPYSSTS